MVSFNSSISQSARPAVAIVVFDIDGVIRDVEGSYRRAIADTVEYFTQQAYRPTLADIDNLKAEGKWNNDWKASEELVGRYFRAQGQARPPLDYTALVDFFQVKYRGRGDDPGAWNGYICQEPLLLRSDYLSQLTQAGIVWGFFSGATRGSAQYVLEKRLGLQNPVLIAMGEAPGKPDPTGLFEAVEQLEQRCQIRETVPVFYVGDTVADLQTIQNSRAIAPQRPWISVGILPPHAQRDTAYQAAYTDKLQATGAATVLASVEQLTPELVRSILSEQSSRSTDLS